MARRVAVICALMFAVAASARAQNGSSGTSTGQSSTGSQTSSSSMATAEETRPATTTFNGDTGLWYVPTAEVLGKGQWSATVYRRGTNWVQGYTNVADFAGTFAYGIGDRAEVFGSFLVDTRIDRDSRPVFGTDPDSATKYRQNEFDFNLQWGPKKGVLEGLSVRLRYAVVQQFGGNVDNLTDFRAIFNYVIKF